MEEKYGQAKRIWVLDRGMISEENMDFLRAARRPVTWWARPRARLKKFQAQLLEEQTGREVQDQGWKSNWWPIPTAVRTNNMFSAVPAPGGKRKRP